MQNQQGSLSSVTIKKEPYEMKYRWVMLTLVSLLYACFGYVQRSMSPLVTPIIKDLNISYSQMGIILGAWQLTYVIMATIGGTVIDRFGIRKSLLFGIFVIGLSAAFRYFASGFFFMLFCVAIFGFGGPMISIGCPKTISEWFTGKERGTAVGIYMAAMATGGLAAFSLTNSVIMPLTGYSWRLTFLLASLPAFITAILWWFLARDIKSTEAKQTGSIIRIFTGLIQIRNVRIVLIMGLLSFTISHGFTNWLPNIMETGGLTPSVASFAASIPLLIGIPSVLVIPRATKPHQRGYALAILYFVAMISLLITATTSGAILITGLCLWGISSICCMPILMLVLMDIPEVGAKYMGSAGGLFFCIAEIGGFLGPAILGAVKNIAGTFLSGAILMAVLALILATMSLMLKIRSISQPKTS